MEFQYLYLKQRKKETNIKTTKNALNEWDLDVLEEWAALPGEWQPMHSRAWGQVGFEILSSPTIL